MSETSLSIQQKKELAKMLFLKSDATQKEIALKVEVSENTISSWVKDGSWDTLRKTLLTTKEQELKNLYDVLGMLNKQAKEYLEDDDPDTNPDADAIIKISKAIKYLEKEVSMGELYESLMQFIDFVRRENLEHAQLVNGYADSFVKQRLNKF